jgi:hypothetical protein
MAKITISNIRYNTSWYDIVRCTVADSVTLMRGDVLEMTITCSGRALLPDGTEYGAFHVKHTPNGYIWRFHKYDGTIQTYGAALVRAETETFKLYVSSHEYKEKEKQAVTDSASITG